MRAGWPHAAALRLIRWPHRVRYAAGGVRRRQGGNGEGALLCALSCRRLRRTASGMAASAHRAHWCCHVPAGAVASGASAALCPSAPSNSPAPMCVAPVDRYCADATGCRLSLCRCSAPFWNGAEWRHAAALRSAEGPCRVRCAAGGAWRRQGGKGQGALCWAFTHRCLLHASGPASARRCALQKRGTCAREERA
jgi:hypothetical protein